MASSSSAIACFLCFGLLVTLASESIAGAKATLPLSSQGMSMATTMATRPKAQVKLNPLNAIKRRVPNGPDPIHNRRAGRSGQPPWRT